MVLSMGPSNPPAGADRKRVGGGLMLCVATGVVCAFTHRAITCPAGYVAGAGECEQRMRETGHRTGADGGVPVPRHMSCDRAKVLAQHQMQVISGVR